MTAMPLKLDIFLIAAILTLTLVLAPKLEGTTLASMAQLLFG